ncbi:MAG: HIT family protein [Planctomycetes bacterium]|nr:HIT family protein [Planctomycetota bacterium]
MPTLFTKILEGAIPGRFVWKDDKCFAILTINPIQPGHCLVIPRQEIDHWLDVPAELSRHLFEVAQEIGKAQMAAFRPVKVGLTILGLEVRHVHLHLIPIREPKDMDFANAEKSPAPAALDEAASKLRAALKASGCKQVAG